MFNEFKQFAFKGNLVDMAVGIILGAGFSGIVKSFVTNVIMPPLGLLLGDVDFTDLSYTLRDAVTEGDKVVKEAVVIKYGQFIDEFVAFVMLAFVVFIIVKKFIASFEKKEVAAPAAPPKQEVLLESILEELKKRG